MRIRLLADYRGVLTDEAYYTGGEYVAGETIPPAHAANLVSHGRAVVIDGPEPEQPPPKRRRNK